jgi:hypothetical protein
MSEDIFRGVDAPKRAEKQPKRDKPDDGLCCLCGTPRRDGFRYLCGECSAESVTRSLDIAAAIVRDERGSFEQRVRQARA